MSAAAPRRPGVRPGSIIAVAALAVAAVLGVIALRRPAGVTVDTARAVRKNLIVSILSDGVLEPPAGGELRAGGAAVVRAILVHDGDRVRRGQEMVRLENPEFSGSAREARSGTLELSAERARAEADAGEARRNAEHQREKLEADRRLLAQGAIPRSAFEATELAAAEALDRRRTADARLSGIAGKGSPSRLSISAASARELELRVAALTVRAPYDGVVYGLPRAVGETVAAGQVVASVADPAHLRVRARVDEPDLPRLASGQRLTVTFDGLPERRWEGKILEVPSGVHDAGGRRVGEAVGEIADPSRLLPPNASVNVQIVAGEKASALAIPRAALQREGEVRFVFVLEDGRARRRNVTVGLVGLNDVEIRGGIPEGSRVILPGGVTLSDGMRVTPRGRT
ncbi:MAG: efflux RND transporter periplasmic adaptor subunit [Acidobacteriota bacterium]